MSWIVAGLIAGVVAWLVKAPPKRGLHSGTMLAFAAELPTAAGVASVIDWPLLLQIALFFGEAGAFVFGSGLAIVPFLYGSVVNEHRSEERRVGKECRSRWSPYH